MRIRSLVVLLSLLPCTALAQVDFDYAARPLLGPSSEPEPGPEIQTLMATEAAPTRGIDVGLSVKASGGSTADEGILSGVAGAELKVGNRTWGKWALSVGASGNDLGSSERSGTGSGSLAWLPGRLYDRKDLQLTTSFLVSKVGAGPDAVLGVQEEVKYTWQKLRTAVNGFVRPTRTVGGDMGYALRAGAGHWFGKGTFQLDAKVTMSAKTFSTDPTSLAAFAATVALGKRKQFQISAVAEGPLDDLRGSTAMLALAYGATKTL